MHIYVHNIYIHTYIHMQVHTYIKKYTIHDIRMRSAVLMSVNNRMSLLWDETHCRLVLWQRRFGNTCTLLLVSVRTAAD
jgi:hypothetical protein